MASPGNRTTASDVPRSPPATGGAPRRPCGTIPRRAVILGALGLAGAACGRPGRAGTPVTSAACPPHSRLQRAIPVETMEQVQAFMAFDPSIDAISTRRIPSATSPWIAPCAV